MIAPADFVEHIDDQIFGAVIVKVNLFQNNFFFFFRIFPPKDGVKIEGAIIVRYMEYPWISAFEIDGIYALPSEEKNKSEGNNE